MKKARWRGLFLIRYGVVSRQAALNHMEVSNALLIIGMFMPKLGFAAFVDAGFAGLSAAIGAVSLARSHDPCSWERATEKNRNT